MNIIILADKYKKRDKNQGCVGLIKINRLSTVLQHQHSKLAGVFPDSTIYYVYGFDHKKMNTYIQNNNYLNIKYIYNSNYENLNEGFSVSILKEFINDDTIIVYGDHIFPKKKFLNINKKHSQVFIDHNNISTIGCVLDNNLVTNIFYGLSNPIHNIFYIAKKDIDILKNELSNIKSHNMFLFEIINKCIDSGMLLNITDTKVDSITTISTIKQKELMGE